MRATRGRSLSNVLSVRPAGWATSASPVRPEAGTSMLAVLPHDSYGGLRSDSFGPSRLHATHASAISYFMIALTANVEKKLLAHSHAGGPEFRLPMNNSISHMIIFFTL